uniref:Putative conserved phosducin-like protein n=1 Tax=Panstrongylus lignarius TaxID=156445 RepID=A0A224XH67_9HEMI
MTTLEDKILGEKKHYYCSSSESEGEEDSDDGSTKECKENSLNEMPLPSPERSNWGGVSKNTGPKGVISDWQRYKQLESEKRQEEELERIELAKKLCLTCAPDSDHQPRNDDDLSDLLSDDFLDDYRKKRMEEMLISRTLPNFGEVYSLANGNEFLDAIDNENKAVTVIIHIYESSIPACKVMNQCLNALCKQYSNVKFCKIVGSSAGMSHRFKVDGVPALLVYKEGQIIGNFVRVTDDLGNEFYEGDVENFLVEHGILLDRFCIPEIIRQGCRGGDNDGGGSDWSLE